MFLRLVIAITVIVNFAACTNSKLIIHETANVPLQRVEGKITDLYSGEGVPGAEVWVEGTTILTATNDEGEFNLQVPNGYYEVLVTHDDYFGDKKRLELVSDKNHTSLQFEILKQSQELSSQELNAGNSRDKKMQKFLDYYIRESENCRVINPEVITFDPSEDDVIRMAGPMKLKIENRELGYLVDVHLQKYIAKNYSGILGLDVEADYLFEELEPKSAEQKGEWDSNREKAFAGSFRHFLIALASEKSLFYFGYRTYSGTFVSSVSSMAYTDSHASDIEVSKDEILAYSGSNTLQFDEELRVEYIEKGVDDPHKIMGLGMYPFRTSWLSLNSDHLNFTKNGTIENKDLLQVKGAWRYVPVCEMLPENYLPEIEGEKKS